MTGARTAVADVQVNPLDLPTWLRVLLRTIRLVIILPLLIASFYLIEWSLSWHWLVFTIPAVIAIYGPVVPVMLVSLIAIVVGAVAGHWLAVALMVVALVACLPLGWLNTWLYFAIVATWLEHRGGSEHEDEPAENRADPPESAAG